MYRNPSKPKKTVVASVPPSLPISAHLNSVSSSFIETNRMESAGSAGSYSNDNIFVDSYDRNFGNLQHHSISNTATITSSESFSTNFLPLPNSGQPMATFVADSMHAQTLLNQHPQEGGSSYLNSTSGNFSLTPSLASNQSISNSSEMQLSKSFNKSNSSVVLTECRKRTNSEKPKKKKKKSKKKPDTSSSDETTSTDEETNNDDEKEELFDDV